MTKKLFLDFLIEFRKRTIHCLLFLAFVFLILIYFANDIYTLLAVPLLKQLPNGQSLIATDIASPFFVPFKLTFFLALFLTIPYILFQVWRFIAPALYKREKRLIWPLFSISILLFYLGVFFAYTTILPVIFHFLAHTSPKGVILTPDMSQYLDFTLTLFFTLGFVFQIPVIMFVLIWLDVVTLAQVKHYRSYAIVVAFILAMLIGPPDILSQTVLAIPLWLLYEIGIFVSQVLIKKPSKLTCFEGE